MSSLARTDSEAFNPVWRSHTGFFYAVPNEGDGVGPAAGSSGGASALDNIVAPIPDEQLPPIAIGLLSYNRAAEVVITLDILLGIDYPQEKLRLIVIDNASTDGTKEIVEEKYGGRVEVWRQPTNIGGVARNRVIMGSEEPYNFVFDEDCSPEHPDTIRRVIEFMEANPYFGALCLRSINLYTQATEFGSWEDFSKRRLKGGGYEGVYTAGNGMCFRHDAIRRSGGYDERWRWGSEEYGFGLEMLYHDIPIALVNDLALIHRRAPRALPAAAVVEKEMRNNIWASFKYFPMPLCIFAALVHTLRRLLAAIFKRQPDRLRAVLRGVRHGLAGLPEIWMTRKPIPVGRIAANNRWFFQSFYSMRSAKMIDAPAPSGAPAEAGKS